MKLRCLVPLPSAELLRHAGIVGYFVNVAGSYRMEYHYTLPIAMGFRSAIRALPLRRPICLTDTPVGRTVSVVRA